MGHTIVIIMFIIRIRTSLPERNFREIDVLRKASSRRAWPLLLMAATAVLCAVLVGLAGAGGVDPSSVQLPDALFGRWKVQSILVDLGSGRRLLYQRDDPRLMGDVFTISAGSITSNTPEARGCTLPRAALWRTTAKSLVATTLAPHGIPGIPPAVKDYELPLDPTASVVAYSIKCNPGRFGPAPLPSARATVDAKEIGTWMVLLPTGDLAVRWYDQTILLLKRNP